MIYCRVHATKTFCDALVFLKGGVLAVGRKKVKGSEEPWKLETSERIPKTTTKTANWCFAMLAKDDETIKTNMMAAGDRMDQALTLLIVGSLLFCPFLLYAIYVFTIINIVPTLSGISGSTGAWIRFRLFAWHCTGATF